MLFPAAVALDPLSGNAFRNLASYLLSVGASWWGRERGRQRHWTESSCAPDPVSFSARCAISDAMWWTLV